MRANACPELAEEGVVCYVREGQAGEQGFDDNDEGGDDDGGSSGGDGGDDDSQMAIASFFFWNPLMAN